MSRSLAALLSVSELLNAGQKSRSSMGCRCFPMLIWHSKLCHHYHHIQHHPANFSITRCPALVLKLGVVLVGFSTFIEPKSSPKLNFIVHALHAQRKKHISMLSQHNTTTQRTETSEIINIFCIWQTSALMSLRTTEQSKDRQPRSNNSKKNNNNKNNNQRREQNQLLFSNAHADTAVCSCLVCCYMTMVISQHSRASTSSIRKQQQQKEVRSTDRKKSHKKFD